MKAAKMEKKYIYGKKVVYEALSRNEKLQKIYIQHGISNEEYRKFEKLARKNKIPLTKIDSRKIGKFVKDSNHQGVVALLSFENIITQEYFVDKLLPDLLKSDNNLFLYLDRIQDPQNFGALLRSAELLGVNVVFYPEKESTPVTPVVIKASMGAALMLPLISIRTPFNFLEMLKKNGINIIGSLKDEDKSILLHEFNFPEKNCIIIGNEETGIKNSLRKLCDAFLYIPQPGQTESFNASVAGGIILYEIIRQKTTL